MFVFEFWLLPELNRFKTKADAKKAYLVCGFANAWRLVPYALVALILSAGPMLILLTRTWLGGWLRSLDSLALALVVGVVPVVLVGGCLLLVGSWFLRDDMRATLWRELNRQGLLTCLACGYDMSGNTTGRCPECGGEFTALPRAPRVEKVPRAVPRWKSTFALVTGVVCLLSGAIAGLVTREDSKAVFNAGLLSFVGIANLVLSRSMRRQARSDNENTPSADPEKESHMG